MRINPSVFTNQAPPFMPGPNTFGSLLSGLNAGFQGGLAQQSAARQAAKDAAAVKAQRDFENGIKSDESDLAQAKFLESLQAQQAKQDDTLSPGELNKRFQARIQAAHASYLTNYDKLNAMDTPEAIAEARYLYEQSGGTVGPLAGHGGFRAMAYGTEQDAPTYDPYTGQQTGGAGYTPTPPKTTEGRLTFSDVMSPLRRHLSATPVVQNPGGAKLDLTAFPTLTAPVRGPAPSVTTLAPTSPAPAPQAGPLTAASLALSPQDAPYTGPTLLPNAYAPQSPLNGISDFLTPHNLRQQAINDYNPPSTPDPGADPTPPFNGLADFANSPQALTARSLEEAPPPVTITEQTPDASTGPLQTPWGQAPGQNTPAIAPGGPLTASTQTQAPADPGNLFGYRDGYVTKNDLDVQAAALKQKQFFEGVRQHDQAMLKGLPTEFLNIAQQPLPVQDQWRRSVNANAGYEVIPPLPQGGFKRDVFKTQAAIDSNIRLHQHAQDQAEAQWYHRQTLAQGNQRIANQGQEFNLNFGEKVREFDGRQGAGTAGGGVDKTYWKLQDEARAANSAYLKAKSAFVPDDTPGGNTDPDKDPTIHGLLHNAHTLQNELNSYQAGKASVTSFRGSGPMTSYFTSRSGQTCNGTQCGEAVSASLQAQGIPTTATHLRNLAMHNPKAQVAPDAAGRYPGGTILYFPPTNGIVDTKGTNQHYAMVLPDGIHVGESTSAGGKGGRTYRTDRTVADIAAEHNSPPLAINPYAAGGPKQSAPKLHGKALFAQAAKEVSAPRLTAKGPKQTPAQKAAISEHLGLAAELARRQRGQH